MLIFDFFLKNFHLFQEIKTDAFILYIIIISSVNVLGFHKVIGAVLGSNPGFGVCTGYLGLLIFFRPFTQLNT